MIVKIVLVSIISVISGYLMIGTLLSGIIAKAAKSLQNILTQELPTTLGFNVLILLAFTILFFFSFSFVYVDAIAAGNLAVRKELAPYWGLFWFIGICLYLFIPTVEGFFRS